MDFFDAMIILGVGMLAGILNTMAGGGSLISLPILIFLGLPPAVANATNRIAIFSQNIFAVAGFKSKGVSEFRYSFLLGCTALIGAIIGAKIAVDIRGELFNKILSVIMVLVVFATIRGKSKPKEIKRESARLSTKIPGAVIFFFIGIYGGFIQAGVGFLIIGTLSALHEFSLVKINSMKVFIVLVYTLAALAVFIYEGKVNWLYGIVLAVGNSAGAWFASRWTVEKGDGAVKIFLVIAVIALSVKLWLF
ncbi:MAG: sulfite exporter TauE/SafE family protein [Cytophagales bacterium]|nr:sulfite exporter TauE/SafE family protein [Cytophagales bacterium]